MTNRDDKTLTSSGFYVSQEAPIHTDNPIPTPTAPAPDILRCAYMELVVTDLAWPHISGVRYWVALGTPVVSHRASREFLQKVVDHKWTLEPDLLERLTFVGTYRGPQAGQGKKSVTMRLRFRAPDRTLRHEEVDPQVESLVAAAKSDLGAALRS